MTSRLAHVLRSLDPAPARARSSAASSAEQTHHGTHPTWLQLSRSALHHNVEICRRAAGGDGIHFIASVKANAYGHGVVPVSEMLAEVGVDTLWTGSFEDATALRSAGLESRVLMFAGALPSAMGELIEAGVTPTIVNLEAAQAVSDAATEPTPVCVKVDCGFGRLGARVDKGALELLRQISKLPNVVLECVYTHLPFTDAPGLEWAMAGTRAFAQLMDELDAAGVVAPTIIQAGASGEILTKTVQPVDTAVCVGHALYGIDPFTTLGLGGDAPLGREAVRETRTVLAAIKSRLIHVMTHDEVSAEYSDTGMSYVGRAADASAESPCTLGIIPYGLGDGARIVRHPTREATKPPAQTSRQETACS